MELESASAASSFPVRHPIALAQTLQNSTDRVLSDYGAVELCENSSCHDLTDLRLQEDTRAAGEFRQNMAGVVAEQELVSPTTPDGTIGVVALDSQGHLAAGTSTGGGV